MNYDGAILYILLYPTESGYKKLCSL